MMSENLCTRVNELLPAYALDSLDADEAVLVSEHLAECAGCRGELASYQNVVDRLALAAPDVAPAPALRRQILHQFEQQFEPSQDAAEPRASWWENLLALARRTAPAWGAAALLLIVGLLAVNIALWQQLGQPRDRAGGMREVALTATEAAPGAAGTFVMGVDGRYGALVVDRLPPLDDTHQYQLWLIRGDERTSGGVFSVNRGGYAALEVWSPEPLSEYDAVGVTIEPAGGSPSPTGERVIGGDL